jgi:hypothetical protein
MATRQIEIRVRKCRGCEVPEIHFVLSKADMSTRHEIVWCASPDVGVYYGENWRLSFGEAVTAMLKWTLGNK